MSSSPLRLREAAQRCLANQEKYKHLNAFISRTEKAEVLRLVGEAEEEVKEGRARGPLHGTLIAIKDNICTTSLPTTAGSAALQTFRPPYEATVVRQLRAAGAIPVGKTNLDEFGMGSHTTHSHVGPSWQQPEPRREGGGGGSPQPPPSPRSVGGSSGGSALAVATGQAGLALGTDTGGSVRLPAAYTGTVGFKPSYGLLSRHGVLAYANSLDTIGLLATHLGPLRTLFRLLNHHDPLDPTSLTPHTRARLAATTPPGRQNPSHPRAPPLHIGVPTHYNIAELHPAIRAAWHHTLALLQEHGHHLHPVPLPSTPAALAAYYILAPAEASSNLAKFDGIRYGSRSSPTDDSSILYARTRAAHLGPEVRRRLLLGAHALSAAARENHFRAAARVRRAVQRDFDAVFARPHPLRPWEESEAGAEVGFGSGAETDADRWSEEMTTKSRRPEKVDVLICPTAPTLPPRLDAVRRRSPVETYVNDVFTVPASLAGLPAVSVPVPVPERGGTRGIEMDGDEEEEDGAGFKVGMQIIGQFGDDELVLDVAAMVEGLEWERE